jgi:hypothetical protein
MRKAEIDALVRAHRGRVRPVAFFHVLRQDKLDPDDHAFLTKHVADLGASDLLRWRARCEKGYTAPVIRQLARRAKEDPVQFQHEVLEVPRLDLDEHEWIELCDLLRGEVPLELYTLLLERGGTRPRRPPVDKFFTPGVIAPPDAPALAALPAYVGPPIDGTAIGELSMKEIVLAKKAGQLAIDDALFVETALERARTSSEDWSMATLEFPGSLKEAVLEKAKRTPRAAERANLLGWLEAHGVARATLLSIALAPIKNGEVSFAIVGWLARQLTTRAAWDKHGLAIFSALMDQQAFAELGDLVTVAWSEASRGDAEPPRALLEAIQVAFAHALVATARGALESGVPPRAMAALSALACLDPPSRVSRAVHELRVFCGSSEEVAELIAVNERLIKHSDARDASFEGVIAAVHAIADAVA